MKIICHCKKGDWKKVAFFVIVAVTFLVLLSAGCGSYAESEPYAGNIFYGLSFIWLCLAGGGWYLYQKKGQDKPNIENASYKLY